jgi:hypothetical protein
LEHPGKRAQGRLARRRRAFGEIRSTFAPATAFTETTYLPKNIRAPNARFSHILVRAALRAPVLRNYFRSTRIGEVLAREICRQETMDEDK